MSDNHKLWDIWEQPELRNPWRVQSINFVAQFKTEEEATKWRDGVLDYRKKAGVK